MNRRVVGSFLCRLAVVLLLLSGCAETAAVRPTVVAGPPAASALPPTATPILPAATSTAMPPTPISTPVPSTSTYTPVPPTPTATPSPLPPTATPTATPSPMPAPDAVVVTPKLNVRDGPGTGYPILAVANQGDKFVVKGQNDGCAWLQVVTSDGVAGWVSGAADFVLLNLPCAGIAQGQYDPLKTAPTTGLVKGRLVPGSSGKSVADRRLLLVSAEANGDSITMNFQGDKDPAAITDSSGWFEFRAVPPGQYVLASASSWPMGLLEDDSGAIILIAVHADDEVDLGRIAWN